MNGEVDDDQRSSAMTDDSRGWSPSHRDEMRRRTMSAASIWRAEETDGVGRVKENDRLKQTCPSNPMTG